MKKLVTIFLILILSSFSCSRIPTEENKIHRSERASRLYSDTSVVYISKDYSFYRTIEDYSIKNPNVSLGVYYKYDYGTNKRNWNKIEELFQKLAGIYIFVNDAWIQGKSSSCVDHNTGIAYYMVVEPMLYISLNEEHNYLEDIGFKLTSGLRFSCPYSVTHYKRVTLN